MNALTRRSKAGKITQPMAAPGPDSLIDVVDARDRPVGTLERGRVLEAGKGFRVAHVWVYSGERFLLQQLGRHRERHPLAWGSSVAGYLHTGESYMEAARRRLGEELGLDLPLRQFGVTPMKDRKSTKFIALFVTDVPRSDLPEIRESEHVEALRYWSRGEVEETLTTAPETFTPTFRHLYRFYTGQGGAGLPPH